MKIATLNSSNLPLRPGAHKTILYADRSDWRNSFSVSPTAIANFADRNDWRIKSSISSMSDDERLNAPRFAGDKIRCDRRIKSPSVSSALETMDKTK